MKKLLLFIAVSINLTCLAQQQASLHVTVMNKQRRGIANDKITFIGQKSGKHFEGITNARGQFLIQLPPGDFYAIKVEVIGDEIDYQTFEVPAPPPGAVFKTVEMEIVYEIPTKVTLKNVLFSSGSHALKVTSYETLDKLVDYLLRKKEIRIRLEGHTDSDGDEVSNLKLSEERAEEIKKYLVKKGIAADRIETKGFGETKPVVENSSSENKAINRRTEVHLLN